jgi:hypothetical protein
MANRERKNELKIYLSDDEQYILEQKVKASGMRDKSSFCGIKFYMVMFMTLTIQSFGNTMLRLLKSATI